MKTEFHVLNNIMSANTILIDGIKLSDYLNRRANEMLIDDEEFIVLHEEYNSNMQGQRAVAQHVNTPVHAADAMQTTAADVQPAACGTRKRRREHEFSEFD